MIAHAPGSDDHPGPRRVGRYDKTDHLVNNGTITIRWSIATEGDSMSSVVKRAQPQDHKSPAVMRALPTMATEWHIGTHDMAHLLGVPDSTYRRWKRRPEGARLDANQLERASYLLGIYKALRILFPDQEAILHWLHTPNSSPVFHDQAPIDRLRAGQVADLLAVRQYLDAARGW